jgi:hypothetical protein
MTEDDTGSEFNSRALLEEPLSPLDQQPSFFDQYYPQPSSKPLPVQQKPACFPGDFLCLAQRNMKTTLGSEMSNAIVASVATLMTDMLNSTIAKSFEMMSHAATSHQGEAQKEAEARAAINMVGSAVSTVSSKVIQGFASFLKVSMSGAMRDLFNTVVNAAARSSGGSGRALENHASPSKPIEEKVTLSLASSADEAVNPSSPGVNNNEIRRSSDSNRKSSV